LSNNDWIGKLIGENFLAVYDIMIDIRNELQLSEKVIIPLFPTIVKFSQLMPIDGINFRDRYCDLRWKAVGLLKKQGVIIDFKLIHGAHRWEGRLSIDLDSTQFADVAKRFDSEYKDRTNASINEPLEPKSMKPVNDPLQQLRSLCLRFPSIVIQLRERYSNRPTLDVVDEYDVQDLLHALLRLYFDDIRPEEWTPSYAGKSSRVDFLLKQEKIVVEVKKTRQGLGAKEVGEQLIVDTVRYSKMDDCQKLVCLIYDPENRISNPGGLESDLSGNKGDIIVDVFIVPKQY